jgi:hypothetical protein
MTVWNMHPTGGAPSFVRRCTEIAAVPAGDRPAIDLCDALPQVDGFGLAAYAENEFKAILAVALERSAGAIDLGGISKLYRQAKRERRIAIVQGDIVIAKGRTDPELFGGYPRLLLEARLWEAGEVKDEPMQLRRAKELEASGVDVIELPTNAAVDTRFARINLAQPVLICRDRFRRAEASGRVTVKWS